MGDLDKTSIIILVCVLTAAVITICLIEIIVYRKKWCRKSKDQPEISGSISSSDIDAYEKYGDKLRGLSLADENEACKGNHNFRNHSRDSNISNWKTVVVDKLPVAVVAPMPPPPPDPPNPNI